MESAPSSSGDGGDPTWAQRAWAAVLFAWPAALALGDLDLDGRARSPRRAWLRSVLADVAEGACSVLEWGYLNRVERAHALPHADRQRRATATLGVTYRDAQFGTLPRLAVTG